MHGTRQEDPENVFVDFASPAPSREFGFGQRLEIGSVTLLRGTFEPSEGAHIAFSKATVAIHEGAPLKLDWRPPESDRIRSPIVASGSAMLVDAGVPVWKRWATPRSIFAFAIDEAFIARISQEALDGAASGGLDTRVGVNDPVIDRLTSLGRQELDNRGAGGRLYVEGIASSLAVHLLRRYGASHRNGKLSKGGLTPAQLRRVVEFINLHLGNQIGLVELAAVAGLSPHHFGEAFKASIGRPPHRYVMERRVQRARELLSNEKCALGEIAYTVGFSSQSHFTTHFRRATGITPGRFRRSLG